MVPPNRKSPAHKPRQDALGNRLPDPAEEIALIERELNELKIAFEQHFLGLDRRAPTRRRDLLGERIRKLKTSSALRTPMLRFRVEQIQSKFSTYDRLWTRTLKEIESGTYHRDLFKLRLKQRRQQEQQAAPPPPPPPQAAPAQGLSDEQLRRLYDTYVHARQRTNESVDGISYESLAANVRRQVPTLLAKYGCESLEFKVVIKDGRALLKAVPKR